MRDPERVTLNDVAAASGVSRATASFVLRDSPNQSISGATRERVRQAARDLGYVPHAIAAPRADAIGITIRRSAGLRSSARSCR